MENGLVMSQELKQKQTLSAYQYQSLHILHLGNAQVGELLKKNTWRIPSSNRGRDSQGRNTSGWNIISPI